MQRGSGTRIRALPILIPDSRFLVFPSWPIPTAVSRRVPPSALPFAGLKARATAGLSAEVEARATVGRRPRPAARRVFRPAVVLIAICAAALGCHRVADQQDAPPPAGTAIEAIGPKGDVQWPVLFEWKAAAGTRAVYRVTVYDAAERPLFEQQTRFARLEAPRELQALLPSTRRFQWRVAEVDADGKPIVETPLVEFTVK